MTVQHTVTLLHASPLHLAAHGARTCWDSHDKSDTSLTLMWGQNEIICGSADAKLIDRVGNKFRHASILEHLNYTFYIEGISRACLQELSRHRHTSPSVKSTRYTLKELKDAPLGTTDFRKFIVMTGDWDVDEASLNALGLLKKVLESGVSNDIAKYCLPEAYKVTEQLTINARSLQNLLSLRSDKSALWEIRQLATSLYEAIPIEHQYLFTHCMKDSNE